jgi:hypothetical protein
MMFRRGLVAAMLVFCTACAPKADLDAAQGEIARLQNENIQLRNQLAERNGIPIKVGFRKAMMGPGLVAVFETTIKSPVSAVATVRSASLGTTKTIELHLNPIGVQEVGHQEGVVFEKGDTLVLENKDYAARTFIVPSAS